MYPQIIQPEAGDSLTCGMDLIPAENGAEGLKNGDEIVTNGTFTVDAAAQLQNKKSMMNGPGGKTTTGHEGDLGMEDAVSIKNKIHSNMNESIYRFSKAIKSCFQ